MRKLILILLAFFAVFTCIRSLGKTETALPSAEMAAEIPVEIVH